MNQKIETHDPRSGALITTYPIHGPQEVQAALAACQEAFARWRRLPPQERAEAVRKIGAELRRQQKALAALATQEMGKSESEAEAEIKKCADCADYYANEGLAHLAPREVPTEAIRSFVAFEPIGTVLAVMPWNFPYWQVFRCLLPSLLAGNTMVLKHASNVSGCALLIESLVAKATGTEGLLRTLLIPGSAAEALISRPEIAGVSFTGSTPVGRRIAAAAGAALKKSVLELGGSDAYVVLADADIPAAAIACAKSRLLNNGQSCISAKRFIVEKSVLPEFRELFVAAMAAAKPAPLARADLREELHTQVEKSVAEGARLILGGTLPSGPGWFYPPTVLSGVRPGMTAFDQELFGPVAALVEATDADEAITLANASPFGLGAAVFTKNQARGIHIATSELAAGSCFVNDFVRSDPRLPFGGTKDSGYGRELSSFGLHEFINIKTIYCGPTTST